MSERNNKSGKRQVQKKPSVIGKIWAQHKDWVSGLDRGQKIRYRILQVATMISVIIIVAFLILQAWIKMPELPIGEQAGLSGSQMGDISFENSDLPDIAQSGRREGVYTFLVAGKDIASGGTDTMLLLTYDINEKTIYGLNLPRDTMINTSATSKRLNAVYARNRGSKELSEAERVEQGMAALKKEVANLTGITPDFYVLVEWEAIGELVDAIGGVEFEVPFLMEYDDPYQDLHIYQEPGLRLLNGDDAMQVIRHRKNNDGSHSGGDVGRLSIQQDFLKAVAKKCLQPATFLKIPELARIFTENVTTDLTVGNVLALAQKAYGMDPDTGVSFQTAPLAASFLYNRAALVTLDAEGILEIVNNGMNPYQRDVEEGDLCLVYRKANGSFGVTNGELADARMGQVTVSQPSTRPEEEEPDLPIEPDESGEGENEDSSQTGDSSQIPDGSEQPSSSGQQPEVGGASSSGETSQSQESSPGGSGIVSIDPEEIFPDPSGGSAAASNTPSQAEAQAPAA